MTDATALRQLIESVEAGKAKFKDFVAQFLEIGNDCIYDAHKAYKGSLDAAKALHEALLPDGFWYDVQPGYAIVYDEHGINDWQTEKNDTDCPARAWLIAILRAYEAQK